MKLEDIELQGYKLCSDGEIRKTRKNRPAMSPEDAVALNKIDNELFGLTLPEVVLTPEIESEVRDLHGPFKRILETRGIFCAYSRSDRATGQREGTPDFLFVEAGIPMAIEFKRPGQKPRAAQIEVMEEMKRNGWRVSVQTNVQEAWAWVCEQTK